MLVRHRICVSFCFLDECQDFKEEIDIIELKFLSPGTEFGENLRTKKQFIDLR